MGLITTNLDPSVITVLAHLGLVAKGDNFRQASSLAYLGAIDT